MSASSPQATAPLLARIPIAVRWRDLDAFDHVNNSSFLTYLEEARIRWLAGIEGKWFGPSFLPVLASVRLDYRRPMPYPTAIVVELASERVGRSSLTIAHRIVAENDSGILYCDGAVVLVWTDTATGRSVDLPEAIRRAVSSGRPERDQGHGG
jgi:acyl-CoA thioester hydrolase